jgi:hypothetical protein
MRKGVSSHFALGKMEGTIIGQHFPLFAIFVCFVVKNSCPPFVFTRLPIHGPFTGNSVNCAIVSLLFLVINRKRFCNPLEINMSEDRILGQEQEISGEVSGCNRERFQGRFLKLCNHLTAMQTTTLRRLSFVVQRSAMSCRNQSKSNQIRLNPTKSNHYFFRENDRAGRCVKSSFPLRVSVGQSAPWRAWRLGVKILFPLPCWKPAAWLAA